MSDDRLPTALWVEIHLRHLDRDGIPYYIHNTGAHAGGMVMLKLNGRENGCKVLIQQRDLDGVLGWANALKDDIMEEGKADDYINRSVQRDPDVWVIEIEDRKMLNPFDDKNFPSA